MRQTDVCNVTTDERNSRTSSKVLLALRCVSGALLLCSLPAMSAETIYMAPDGLDSNPGRSSTAAVKTLCRVQAILDASTNKDQDVEVRIKQGVYYEPGVRWRHYRAGHSISFMPIDWDPGEGIQDIAGRPIFRRAQVTAGERCQTDAKEYWFFAGVKNSLDPGGPKNLIFRYLQVQDYVPGGISFDGETEVTNGITVPKTAGVNNNTVFGMMFYRLGTKWNTSNNPDTGGRGAIITSNSSGNTFQYNHFVQIENRADEISLIHGIYLANHSNDNVADSNRFDRVSGDPIRTRNDSNSNVFINNDFIRSGYSAYYSEWFCDGTCPATHGIGRECASHNNEFKYNYLESGYEGNAQGLWLLTPAGLNYAGGVGCDNEGQVRLDTQGNIRP